MSENENKLENLDNIFTKNVIQVTDEKSTVDIFWDTTDTPETAAFVHKNNMKILAMCIGRMIDDVGVRNIVLYDVAAHGDWEKSTIDSIYCIGSSNKLLTLYYIALGKINMKPQQLIELKSFRINAIDAAITFDGEWVLNNSSNVFSLKTEDVPWIFYITYAGKLYRKYGTAAAAELTAENVKLVAYDQEGAILENVEMVPSKVNATVTVDSYHATKPVKIITTGSFSNGYAISSIESSVKEVVVYGEKSVVDALTNVEATVDLSSFDSNKENTIETTLDLNKPTGVREMSATKTKVKIKVIL